MKNTELNDNSHTKSAIMWYERALEVCNKTTDKVWVTKSKCLYIYKHTLSLYKGLCT